MHGHEITKFSRMGSLPHFLTHGGPLRASRATALLKTSSLNALVGGGGGTRQMKGVGMLVVSLRGVNFGFWSHLGCSGQNAIIFSCEGLV